jgi:Holliday junction resolvasome RuvABC endonuclease subunit
VRILALDLGTLTGWAFWNGARRESGVQIFDVRRGESPGMRYVRFNTWLGTFGNSNRPELVVYEQTHNRGGAATEVAAGFATRVQEWCARWPGQEHAAVHSATLKKWTTGRGNAKKPEMIQAVLDRFDHGRKGDLGDDEADAIALLEYARAELIPEEISTREDGD